MAKDDYRLVPYRFLLNDSNTDTCKLERLTNLFPEMKAIIELELFKINNLTRTIDRLSKIYTILSAVNARDDTLHIFLGPFHITIGPTIFGALQFKNVSTALLHSKKGNENTNQHQTRRHDASIRRFRRIVRKLILIRSIIDKIRLASVLTPYNQYELYTQGIYDLVLSGHIHNSHTVLVEDSFSEQIKSFRVMNKLEKENSLLQSRFIKVNALLQLLSPIPTQSLGDNNITAATMTSNDAGESPSKSFIDTTGICCTQHCDNLPLVPVPIHRSAAIQSSHILPPETSSTRNTNDNVRRKSSSRPQKKTTSSLPDLTTSDGINANILSRTAVSPLYPVVAASDKSTNNTTLRSNKVSSRLNTKLEDAIVNRISSLLTSYFITQQTPPTSFYTDDNYKNLESSPVPLSSMTARIPSNDSDISTQSSSIIEPNDFDNLLQRIKTIVDDRLSMQTNSRNQSTTPSSMKTPTNNRRQHFGTSRAASFQEASIDEFDGEYLKTPTNKRKLTLSSKSQSFDDTNPKLSLEIFESDDNSITF